jgi:two-component system cell cycle sensor histidine kinase/response regulator CckA
MYRCCLLDDDVNDQELIRREIAHLGPLDMAQRGDQFRDLLGRNRYDCLLMDFQVPPSDFFSELAEVKKRAPDTPVIVVSGSIHQDQLVATLEAGAAAFVSKEFIKILPYEVIRVIHERKLREAQMTSQRMENIGSLASGIVHDVNNILFPVGIAIGLATPKLPPDMRPMMNNAQVLMRRAATLFKQLLSIARGKENSRKRLNLAQLLREIIPFIGETFPKSLEMKLMVDDEPIIVANESQIYQVVLNLCINARDAMEGIGSLTVTLDETQDESGKRWARIAVVDSGPGIAEPVLSHIFEPFFTTKANGTGLGLSTVQNIVRAHGGTISTTSMMSIGTTFTILLPVTDVLSAEEKARRESSGKGRTILLVDDEASIREILSALLTDAGYEVLLAENGLDGLRRFREITNREKLVIVSDIMMSVMDGPRMVEEIRKTHPNIKVLCLTGVGSGSSADMRAQACLEKPFTADALLLTLDSLFA